MDIDLRKGTGLKSGYIFWRMAVNKEPMLL